jgi:creatinine amidohydrolase
VRTNQLARLTWREVADIVKEPPVVLLPIGSLEQNGTACPLGTDTIVAEYFSQKLAESTDSLVAPPICYGSSEPFKGFPGTIWLRPQTMHRVVRDILLGLADSGFTHILVVNNHGRNEPFIESAVRDVCETHSLVVGQVWPFGVMARLARNSGTCPSAKAGHGGEPMVSIIKAIAPDDVRLEGAESGQLSNWGDFEIETSNKATFKGMPIGLYVDIANVSDNGTTGDPQDASQERGDQLLEGALSWATEAVAAFRKLRPANSSR